jgi:hypothetical protein
MCYATIVTLLYHITHMNNLAAIVAAGGLWCDRVRTARGLKSVGIAHQHIKDRRRQRPVQSLTGESKGAGGTLWEYVPFYFAPRSPMLFTIHLGNVEGYEGGQRPVVHLETTVKRVCASGMPCAFTDGHGDMAISDFSDDFDVLESFVDWSVMQSLYWNDTAELPDRKRRRQAEFLVHEFVPWSAIRRIGVLNAGIAAETQHLVSGHAHQPEIVVARDW